MLLQKLYSSASFSPGADLWIIPDLNNSHWSNKLNWYLNYQISRVIHHRIKELSPQLQNILNHNNFQFEFQTKAPKDAPVLISPNQKLPCKQILLHHYSNKKEWFKNIYHSWINLNSPETRLFLPFGVIESDVQELWPHQEDEEYLKMTLVIS